MQSCIVLASLVFELVGGGSQMTLPLSFTLQKPSFKHPLRANCLKNFNQILGLGSPFIPEN